MFVNVDLQTYLCSQCVATVDMNRNKLFSLLPPMTACTSRFVIFLCVNLLIENGKN